MINDNRGSVVLMVILIILVLMISAGIYVARTSTIGLRVMFNEKDYTNSFYALDSVATWFLEDPDSIINSSTTKYVKDEFKTVDSSMLPDYQIPNRGHIRDNVKLEVVKRESNNLATQAKFSPGNDVGMDNLVFNAKLSDKKSFREIEVGVQFVLPKAD
ncbi:MAG TPA: hypothetical protein VIS94_00075 [Desulfomonilia bacterium]